MKCHGIEKQLCDQYPVNRKRLVNAQTTSTQLAVLIGRSPRITPERAYLLSQFPYPSTATALAGVNMLPSPTALIDGCAYRYCGGSGFASGIDRIVGNVFFTAN
jgi:hypothetical protein